MNHIVCNPGYWEIEQSVGLWTIVGLRCLDRMALSEVAFWRRLNGCSVYSERQLTLKKAEEQFHSFIVYQCSVFLTGFTHPSFEVSNGSFKRENECLCSWRPIWECRSGIWDLIGRSVLFKFLKRALLIRPQANVWVWVTALSHFFRQRLLRDSGSKYCFPRMLGLSGR